MVQEEATKLSKRAKRRAAGEETSEGVGAGDLADDVASEDEAAEADAPDVADAPTAPGEPANRQARRTAAAKARARRKRERAEASAIGLDAGEMVDDALVRFTDKVSRLARRYWNAIQWVLGLGVLGWLGYQVYAWRRAANSAEISDALFDAVALERGHIGDPKEQGKPNANGIIDPTPIFETEEARRQAAIEAHQKVAALNPSSVAAGFAELSAAGVLFEEGKFDEALAAYQKVAAGKAVDQSPELRGGAIEGRALSLEAKNDLPGALAAFEELGNVPTFENRALYEQARIKQRQGDIEASKSLLTKLFKVLGPPKVANLGGLPERPDFLRERAVQLASVVDPLEKDVKIPKPPLGADAVQQMLEQLKESGVVSPPAPSP